MLKLDDIQDFDYNVRFVDSDRYDEILIKLYDSKDYNMVRGYQGEFTIKKDIMDVLNAKEYALYKSDIIMNSDLNIVCPNQDSSYDVIEQFTAIAQLREILAELQTINNKDKEYLDSLKQEGLDDYISSLYIPREAYQILDKFGIHKIWQLLLVDQSILHILPDMDNEMVNAIRISLKEHGYDLRDTVKVVSGEKIERPQLNNHFIPVSKVVSSRPKYAYKSSIYNRVDKETELFWKNNRKNN